MAKQKSIVAQLRALSCVDTVGRNKEGYIVVRRGFYYTHGRDANDFADQVRNGCKLAGVNAIVTGCGEVWKDFAGGKSVAQNSHWWVELETVDKPTQS